MGALYLVRDIPAFAMYCVYGTSRSSLLIESVDYRGAFCTFTLRKGIPRLRDSIKYFDYFRVTLSCNFRLPRARGSVLDYF